MNASNRSTSTEPSANRGFVNRLSALSDADFQQRLAQCFESQGYTVDRDTGDPQVDLMLQIADQLWFVQTRNWRAPAVEDDAVTELLDVVNRNAATGGIVICSGTFSEAARLKARGTGVRLINGVELADLLRETPTTIDADACPRCGSSLIERLAEDASRRFRGCSSYPDCRYTEGAAA